MDRMIHCRARRAGWRLAVPPARTRRSTREHHLLPGRRGDSAASRCSTAAGTNRASARDRRQPAPARRPLPGARLQHPHPGAAVLRGAAGHRSHAVRPGQRVEAHPGQLLRRPAGRRPRARRRGGHRVHRPRGRAAPVRRRQAATGRDLLHRRRLRRARRPADPRTPAEQPVLVRAIGTARPRLPRADHGGRARRADGEAAPGRPAGRAGLPRVGSPARRLQHSGGRGGGLVARRG